MLKDRQTDLGTMIAAFARNVGLVLLRYVLHALMLALGVGIQVGHGQSWRV